MLIVLFLCKMQQLNGDSLTGLFLFFIKAAANLKRISAFLIS